MRLKPVDQFNKVKVAYTRAGWILSLPNTVGILFLIWTNAEFQNNYSKYFFSNFWVFLICIAVPFAAYMAFEYFRVWNAEIELSNRRSWDVECNPIKDHLVQINRDVKELRKAVENLERKDA